MGPQSRYNTHKELEEAYSTITMSLKFYLDNKKLINGSEEDLTIGVSNIINSDLTDIGIIALAKSLSAQKRSSFLISLTKEENWNTDNEMYERRKDLTDRCEPWSEIFKKIKNKPLINVEKEIVEYEISKLYLDNINNGKDKFIKKINMELAW